MTQNTKYHSSLKRFFTPFRIYLLVLFVLILICYGLLAFESTDLKAQNLAFTPPVFNTILVCGIASCMLFLISIALAFINFVGKKSDEKPWLNLLLISLSSLISLALIGVCGLYLFLMLIFGFQDAKLIDKPNHPTTKQYVIDQSWLDPMYEYHDVVNPLLMTASSKDVYDTPQEFKH